MELGRTVGALLGTVRKGKARNCIMLYLYISGIYFLVTVVVCIIGFQQGSWLERNCPNTNILSFRKPTFYRLGTAMMGLLFLGFAFFFASAVGYFGVTTWFFFVPVCLLFTCLFVYTAGPEDVSIDLETRTYQQIKGCMLHPRKRTGTLTDASCVCIVAGGKSYYVNLMVGIGTDLWFLIARSSRMSDAQSFAKEIADKLHLSVRETTFEDLRKLA